MPQTQSIAATAKFMRIAFFSILIVIALCLFGVPALFGIEVDPMSSGSWISLAWLCYEVLGFTPNLPPEISAEELAMINSTALISDFSTFDKILTFAFFTVLSGLIIYVFYQIDRLFKHYQTGKVFTIESVRRFRSIGYGLISVFVFSALSDSWLEKMLNSSFEGFDLSSIVRLDFSVLFAGLFMLAVAAVMQQGVFMQDDLDATI